MYRDKYIFFYVSGSRIARCTSAMSRFAGKKLLAQTSVCWVPLRGARAPCPNLLEKNFSPKPLFVGFMAISVSGYYGDFISVGTGGY